MGGGVLMGGGRGRGLFELRISDNRQKLCYRCNVVIVRSWRSPVHLDRAGQGRAAPGVRIYRSPSSAVSC